MDIEKIKWDLPSVADGNAFMIRSNKAEEHLKQSLDLLHHIKDSIPHKPASPLKSQIEAFLIKFK